MPRSLLVRRRSARRRSSRGSITKKNEPLSVASFSSGNERLKNCNASSAPQGTRKPHGTRADVATEVLQKRGVEPRSLSSEKEEGEDPGETRGMLKNRANLAGDERGGRVNGGKRVVGTKAGSQCAAAGTAGVSRYASVERVKLTERAPISFSSRRERKQQFT